MVIKTIFNIGDIVYLKTDPDQYERIIVGFEITTRGLMYILNYISSQSYHYEFEITGNKNILKQLDIYKKEN